MTDIDPKVIKKTQDTLGKLIKRPPLTDKLLSRPPFRFIHDICSAVSASFDAQFQAYPLNRYHEGTFHHRGIKCRRYQG